MNISWRRRPLVGERWPPIDHLKRSALEAMLGRSLRIDGQPRRRHIASLGCIDETALDHPAHRHAFWLTARARLPRLGLTAKQEADIVAKLEERVAPIAETAFVAQADWLALYLVDPDAADAAASRLHAAGAIDPEAYAARRGFVDPVHRALALGQRYQEALMDVDKCRREARRQAIAGRDAQPSLKEPAS